MQQSRMVDAPLTWEEIRTHDNMSDLWIVIDGYVYDLSAWARRHPGGRKVLEFYGGQDATEAWLSFHNDKALVQKYMKPLCLGKLEGENPQESDPIRKDFRQLRETAEKMGLFQPNYWFYAAHLAHTMLIYLAAYLTVLYGGDGLMVVLLSGVLLATGQQQAGWLQHDFGHLSVFKTMWMENLWHLVTIGLLKGASSGLWRDFHYRHHAKTNVIEKDPDILEPPLFVIGDIMPVEEAKKSKKTLPYNFQHLYYIVIWLFVPYHSSVFLFSIRRQRWQDVAFSMSFYAVFLPLFLPQLGLSKTIMLYIVMRALESQWYCWVTQMTHMGLEVGREKNESWMVMQVFMLYLHYRLVIDQACRTLL
ncbi:FADS1 [Branchiostoma lanceolatum]|uniref:FADS1 protein n=1 Tax=Branchiostoma lanceolatum TaxID=7740 RepID=A0A8J9ZHW3_BRALA|nr:FADS1 [Branchiostoma lanceolatum]